MKDVALHILGDDVSYLSRHRDDFHLVTDLSPWGGSLLAFINEWNDLWVRALRRISPALLCDLLAFTGPQFHAYLETLDLDVMGDSISWAGPQPRPVGVQVAREYTEYWMHQQHIRDAVEQPGLTEPRYFAPLLATFVLALPHAYRDTPAPRGTCIRLVITGPAGGTWDVVRGGAFWDFAAAEAVDSPAATVTIDADTAWRIFTKGLSADEATARATITGNAALARPMLSTVAIIA